MDQYEKILLTVITEADLENEIVHLLQKTGVGGYTISDVRGAGHRGERSGEFQSTSNIKVEILCGKATAENLENKIRLKFFENYALIMFVSQVSVFRSDKFK